MVALIFSLLLLLAAVKSWHQNFGSVFTFFPVNSFNCDLLFYVASINIRVCSMTQTCTCVRTGRTVIKQAKKMSFMLWQKRKKKQQSSRKKCFLCKGKRTNDTYIKDLQKNPSAQARKRKHDPFRINFTAFWSCVRCFCD